jgi:hypothetical protein
MLFNLDDNMIVLHEGEGVIRGYSLKDLTNPAWSIEDESITPCESQSAKWIGTNKGFYNSATGEFAFGADCDFTMVNADGELSVFRIESDGQEQSLIAWDTQNDKPLWDEPVAYERNVYGSVDLFSDGTLLGINPADNHQLYDLATGELRMELDEDQRLRPESFNTIGNYSLLTGSTAYATKNLVIDTEANQVVESFDGVFFLGTQVGYLVDYTTVPILVTAYDFATDAVRELWSWDASDLNTPTFGSVGNTLVVTAGFTDWYNSEVKLTLLEN